jgi:hypothetical protein
VPVGRAGGQAEWAGHDEELARSREDREFQRRLEAVTVSATSSRGWIRVRSRALVSWHIRIPREPVGSLSEQEFLAEVDGAVASLLADYRAQVTLLTDAIYDIGVPRALRAAGGQGS